MTGTGISVGTVEYMSPEQAAGERNLDARSDIYSLGAVAYEMLVGKSPVSAASAQAMLAKLMTETPVPPHTARAEVPVSVSDAVQHALEKHPAQRFRPRASSVRRWPVHTRLFGHARLAGRAEHACHLRGHSSR
jgi:serine/threonine-protein kinase